VRWRLALFKLLYYVVAATRLPAMLRNGRERRRRVVTPFSGGTTSQDPA